MIVTIVNVKESDLRSILEKSEDAMFGKRAILNFNFLDVSSVTNMSWVFARSSYDFTFNGNISEWDVSSVVDMKYMFKGSNFNGDISGWNVSNVKYMESMFAESKFDQDISGWNVENVMDMSWMFSYSDFNQDISKWKLNNITDMSYMFYSNDSFYRNLSGWDLREVKHESILHESIFYKCPMENKPEFQPKFNKV